MDFALAERQQAVAALAAEVLGAADPWKELARAGLLGVSPPDGLGVLDAAVLLTEIGRRAPSRQALATLMTGALPVARWGSGGRVAAGAVAMPTTSGVDNGWHYPMGIATPAATVAMVKHLDRAT